MRRIKIDEHLEDLANRFCDEVKTLGAITKLQNLRDELKPPFNDYVDTIIQHYDDLILAKPLFEKEEQTFTSILSDINIEDIEEDGIKLWKRIVKAMRYDKVQADIYPKYVVELGIKACVYCNAQYVVALVGPHDTMATYQIDHWRPQSKYPYLSTSFYNLQPSCGHCNQKKSDEKALFNLFTTDQLAQEIDPMKFSLDDDSVALYQIRRDSNVLSIKFDCPDDDDLLNNHEDLFQISWLYKAHRDTAEEIVWKMITHNSTMRDLYRRTFKELKFKNVDFDRFALGNYTEPELIHRRPLAKLTYDLGKQFKLI